MDGLPKVWCSDLQSALEMLSQGVIINDETGHLGVAKHVFLEMLAEYRGIAGIVRDTLTPLGQMKQAILSV